MSLIQALEQLNRDCQKLSNCEHPAKAYAKVQLDLLSLMRGEPSVNLVMKILQSVKEFSNQNPKISASIDQACSKATTLEELEVVYAAICSEYELDEEIELEKARIRSEAGEAPSHMKWRTEEEHRMALIREANRQDHLNRLGSKLRQRVQDPGERQKTRNEKSELSERREQVRKRIRELLELDDATRAEVLTSEPLDVVEYWNEFLDRRERARKHRDWLAEHPPIGSYGCNACGQWPCKCWR